MHSAIFALRSFNRESDRFLVGWVSGFIA